MYIFHKETTIKTQATRHQMYKSYCSSTRNTRNQDNIAPPKSVNPTVVASSESLLHETPENLKG